MHIADAEITNTWVNLATLTPGTTTDTYTLVNGSPDIIYVVESSSTPAAGLQGNPVYPGCYVVYKKGSQDLYARNGYISVTGQPAKKSRLIINKKG